MIDIHVRSKGFTTIDPNDSLTLENVELHGEDFSGKKVKTLSVVTSKLYNCRFENLKLDSAAFGGGTSQSVFTDCIFDNSIFKHCILADARFIRCSFKNVKINDFFSFTSEFIDCIFSGKLKKAIFHGKISDEDQRDYKRDFNEFHGNDFSGMEFDDVDFRGDIDLDNQKLPKQKGYFYLPNVPETIQHAKHEIQSWPDEKLKHQAMIIVKTFEEDIGNGQKQFFVHIDDFVAHKTAEKLIALLQRKND